MKPNRGGGVFCPVYVAVPARLYSMKKAIYIFTLLMLAVPVYAQSVPTLRFTEIMYDLDGSDTGREWAELYNYGTDPVEILTGTATTSFRFFDGSKHTLKLVQGDAIIQHGGFAILADNPDMWLLEHPGFTGTIFDTVLSLKNTSSTIGLSVNASEPLFTSVVYDFSWGAAGDGHTLEKKDILSAADNASDWTVSTSAGGTPGFWEPFISMTPTITATTTQPVATTTPQGTESTPTVNNDAQQVSTPPPQWSRDIIINEALPNPTGSDSMGEWIELYNRGNSAVELDGWSVQDSSSTVYAVSEEDFALTTISPGGYFVIPREQSGVALNNSGGDAVKLYWPNKELVDAVFYGGSAPEEQSWSRLENSWQWATPTKGAENQPLAPSDEPQDTDETESLQLSSNVTAALPPEGALFVSEIMPNPDGRDDHEWIELHASSTEPIDLTGWSLDDNDGGSKPYVFPAGTNLTSDSYVVFDKDVTKLSLNNAQDLVRLIDPQGKVWDQVVYEKAPSGESYAYDAAQDEWSWVETPTLGVMNVFEQIETFESIATASVFSGSEQTAEGQVIAKGIVLMPAGILAKRSMYIASEETEESRTIELYNYHGEFPKLHAGDRIEATGTLSEQNNLLRLSLADASSITLLDTNRPVANRELDIAGLNSDESRSWVTIAGTVSRVSDKSFSITKDEDRITVYPVDSAAQFKPVKGDEVSVSGFLYYRSDTPYLYLMRPEDLVIVENVEVQGYATSTIVMATSTQNDPAPAMRWYFLGTIPIAAVVGWFIKRFFVS